MAMSPQMTPTTQMRTHRNPLQRAGRFLHAALVVRALLPSLSLLAWMTLASVTFSWAASDVARAADDVTRWDGDARSAARLVAGSQRAPDGALRAGVEIRLKAGWHTYWRYPGDAGVPPKFDFAASTNLKRAVLLFPAPQRLVEAGGTTLGYSSDVMFPVRVEPVDAKKPVMLRLKLDYAICEKLCVPAEATVELALGTFKGATSGDAALATAEMRVPRVAKLGADGPLAIKTVRREGDSKPPRVLVDVATPSGAVDLFAEGPTAQWALPVPTKIDGAPAGQQRFAFELDGLPPGESDRGAVLTLTATAPGDAVEVAIRLD
jgi:DsbC/DsbD-like thiol-disulfide interchange protein